MNTKAQLQQLYHTLSLIETKGENTLMMAACLSALQQIHTELTKNQDEVPSGSEPEPDEVSHE